MNIETHSCLEEVILLKRSQMLVENDEEASDFIYGYGSAIESITKIPNHDIWLSVCDEKTAPIKFCPFCGIKLIKD